jgi:hypothetical protein
LIIVDILHWLSADSDTWFVLQLQRDALGVDCYSNACVSSTIWVAAILVCWLSTLMYRHSWTLLWCESEAASAGAWNADETLVRALLEHAAVVSATFGGRLGLIDLHLLDPAEGVFCSWVASSGALSTWDEILSSSGLHISTSGQTVTESLRVEVGRGVVHVLTSSAILACTH